MMNVHAREIISGRAMSRTVGTPCPRGYVRGLAPAAGMIRPPAFAMMVKGADRGFVAIAYVASDESPQQSAGEARNRVGTRCPPYS